MSPAIPLLLVAIATEVGATAALPKADGFRNPVWAVAVVAGYVVSTWLLAIVVRYMDVSAVYAIWAGLGTASIAVIGVLFLHERLDALKVVAVAMIVIGVVVLNLRGGHDGESRPHSETAGASSPGGA